MMTRTASAVLLALALITAASMAQDGPIRRAGRALDNAGKNIRNRVETEVARGQITAQERNLLERVTARLAWDKQLTGAALQVEVRPDGAAILRGSVTSEAARARAADLAESTVGVTGVVNELAVAKEVQVLRSQPAVTAVEVLPPVPAPAETKVIVPAETKVVVPPASEVIVKP